MRLLKMTIPTISIPTKNLLRLGLKTANTIHYQSSPEELVQDTLRMGEGVLNDTGALLIRTGEFTGRSPKDKFIVEDSITKDSVDWASTFNQPVTPEVFDALYAKITAHLASKDIFVRDCVACAHDSYKLKVRVVTENPWANPGGIHNWVLLMEESSIEKYCPNVGEPKRISTATSITAPDNT